MVNAQEWLDENYPCNCNFHLYHTYHSLSCPKELQELNLRNLNLEGDLDLDGFVCHYYGDPLKVRLAGNPKLGEIKNKPEGTILIYQNPQEWLNRQYADKERVEWINLADFEQPSELILDNYPNLKEIDGKNISNLTKLIISNCSQLEKINIVSLESNKELTLSSLPNLRKFSCEKNNLTTLDLTKFSSLQIINCSCNKFTQIKLPEGKKLEGLNLNSNNFRQDLSFLKDLVNLRELNLANNNFYGSLENLKRMNKLEGFDINDTDIDSGLEYLPESIKGLWCSTKERPNAKVKTIYNLFANEQGEVETEGHHEYIKNFPQKLKDYKQKIVLWKNLDFTSKEVLSWIDAGFKMDEPSQAKNWKDKDFNAQQTRTWIKAGAKIDDHEFINFLQNTKKETPEWITNSQENYQNLSKRYKEYELCSNCQWPKNTKYWCRDCNSSGSSEVDDFIEKYQQRAANYKGIVEWIPYENFTETEYLAEGGFGKVYKAKWNDKDDKQKPIALKSLNDSANIKEDFLQEITYHKQVDKDGYIVPCYGISCDPTTKNYAIVMEYIPDGNLQEYLKDKRLSFKDKINKLRSIVSGLNVIHEQKLVHRDFHAGNILNWGIISYITDLGLCRPVGETSQEKIFGVLPYVAPEVLTGKPYTQASDIYSFGIIAYQVLSGLPPYYDKKHDEFLGMHICQGLRPEFQIKVPLLLEDLIKRCWDFDLEKRPTAGKLKEIFDKWQDEIRNEKNTEFTQQVKEAEEYNKTLPDEERFPKYQIHYGAIYTSRCLPTKEIAQLLQNPLLNELLNELKKVAGSTGSSEQKYNDLKKVLKLIFKKSEELEKIIADNKLHISEEIKSTLIKIKELKAKDNSYQNLKKKESQKKQELEEKLSSLRTDKKMDTADLYQIKKFLKEHELLAEYDAKLAKRSILKLINETEIDQFCRLQKEITNLENQLEKSQKIVVQSTQQITQTINIINQGVINKNCKQVDMSDVCINGNNATIYQPRKMQSSDESQNNFLIKNSKNNNIMENKQNQTNIGFSSSESIANYSNTTVESNKLSITSQGGTSQSTTIGYKAEGGFVEYVGASVRENEIIINAEKSPLEQATERIKSKLSEEDQPLFDGLLKKQIGLIEKDTSYTGERLGNLFKQVFDEKIEISEIEKLFQLLQIQVQQQSQQTLQVQPNFQ